MYDIVVHNGTIITVNPDFEIITNGSVYITGDRIDKIIASCDNDEPPDAKKIIDANGGLIMPGLVNTHTHLPMSIFRGLADDLPLMTWLNEHIFPAEAKHINSDSVYYGALLSCAEMIMSGTTTCCDGYFLEDKIAEAVCESGMRGVLAQGVIDFPAPGVPDPKDNIKHATNYVLKWNNKNPLITPSIFCHSPLTCSGTTIQQAKQIASNSGLLFQIHTAETQFETEQILTEHKMSPVEYLDHLGVIDNDTLIIHGVWLNKNDISILASRDANVSHNPESNMKLASGIAPVPDLLNAHITTGIGTDGCASNNNLDLFSEMNFTAKLHKVNTLDPTVLDAKTVIKMATIEGAKAIGLGAETGSIEEGKQADIIIIDINKPHLTPMFYCPSHIVYSARGSDVEHVIVAGEILLENKKILSMGTEEILKKIRNITMDF